MTRDGFTYLLHLSNAIMQTSLLGKLRSDKVTLVGKPSRYCNSSLFELFSIFTRLGACLMIRPANCRLSPLSEMRLEWPARY